jgi:hypothetical protein
LAEPAISRVTIITPAEEAGAVPQSEIVDSRVGDLADDHRLDRDPLAWALSLPPAVAWETAVGEALAAKMRLKPPPGFLCDWRRENAGLTNMVEEAILSIEPEEQDDRLAVATRDEATDHAVEGVAGPNLDHQASAARVEKVALLGNDALDAAMLELPQPRLGAIEMARLRSRVDVRLAFELLLEESTAMPELL